MEILIPLIVVIILFWLFIRISSEPGTTQDKNPTPVSNHSTQDTSYHDRLKKKRLEEQQLQAEKDFLIAQKQKENEIERQRLEIEKIEFEKKKTLEDQLLRKKEEEKKQYEIEQNTKAKKQNELLQIEIGTDYSDTVEEAYYDDSFNFNFNTIRQICIDYAKELPKEKSNAIWRELNNGVALLNTDAQLRHYIYSYGNMHQAKLKDALKTCINRKKYQPSGEKIEIIDWGCGQGIGAMILIDYLKANTDLNCSISKVILIEPSLTALKRAGLHISYSLMSIEQNTKMILINKALDDIVESNIHTDKDAIKFHIFSNILDVEDFEINELCNKLNRSQDGTSYFICVSPSINHTRNQRLDEFQDYLTTTDNLNDYEIISERDTDIHYYNKIYKRYEKVFLVDFSFYDSKSNVPPFAPADPDEDDLPF